MRTGRCFRFASPCSYLALYENALNSNYILRSRAFLALDDFELHLLPFAQGLEALAPNGAVVNEDIPAAVTLDEAVAF